MEARIPLPEIKIDRIAPGQVTATISTNNLVMYAQEKMFINLIREIVREFAKIYVEKHYDEIAAQVNTKQIADEVSKMLLEKMKESDDA